ncbi:hypothetical protein [Goodfellowiella coeruleoviolacea]|uniref:hypothetical protein n=1 Tax=Goodfellowiella coeruleoviolacea TaxID=334858 RepID=UPI0020A43105|nr:hypothetical protein [Goodfellowiella coeruleoviolacea]
MVGCSSGGSTNASGSTSSASSTTAASGDAKVTWANDYCGALIPLATVVNQRPEIDTSNMAATRTSLIGFFGNLSDGLGQSLDGLKGLGAAPSATASGVVESVTKTLTDIKAGVDESRAALDKADPANPAAMSQAMTGAGSSLGKLANIGDTMSALEKDPELAAAGDKAPKCEEMTKALESDSTSASSSSEEPSTSTSGN